MKRIFYTVYVTVKVIESKPIIVILKERRSFVHVF